MGDVERTEMLWAATTDGGRVVGTALNVVAVLPRSEFSRGGAPPHTPCSSGRREGAHGHQQILRLEPEGGGQALPAETLAPRGIEGAGGVAILDGEPDVVAIPSEADPGGAVGLSPDQLGSPGRLDQRHRGPKPPELPVGRRGSGEAQQRAVGTGDEAPEELAQVTAPQRADVTGEVGDRGGLRLSQVVSLGVFGQSDLDHVERADVGLVALGPRNPHPHHGPCRQVHDGGVLGS